MASYNIISTGSKGNAVVINKHILIDCGVPFKKLLPVLRDIRLVLLTHAHSDHFKPSTVKRLAAERPTIRFGCCPWMVKSLVEAGVSATQIDIYAIGGVFQYINLAVEPVQLVHDVPNCGYKLRFDSPFGTERLFYATDTGNLNGIEAKGYDLYLVEANYTDEDIQRRIDEKKAAGDFSYEPKVIHNHLSEQQCLDWLFKNMGSNSEYVYLHCHEEREGSDVK